MADKNNTTEHLEKLLAQFRNGDQDSKFQIVEFSFKRFKKLAKRMIASYPLLRSKADTDDLLQNLWDRLVVIAPGYPAPMDEFLSANPGLESRFTRFIYFDNYSVADMCRIFEQFCKNNQYSISQIAKVNLFYFFHWAFSQKNDKFGNGRFVRNVNKKTLGHLADRLSEFQGEHQKSDLTTIKFPDISFEMLKTKLKKLILKKTIGMASALGAIELPREILNSLDKR